MSRLGVPGLLMCLAAGNAVAEIVIDRTRLIYLASEREVSVTLTNFADSPRLVQAWIDAGDAQVQPEYSDVPFSLVPPILRIEPGKGQALRIILQPPLEMATETVYWLNVLSIRPNPEAQASNTLQWAFRTRIKLFLRTRQPSDSDQPVLRWRLTRTAPALLEVHNPSAYHVTVSRILVIVDGTEHRSDAPPMVAPNSGLTLPLDGALINPWGRATLHFSTLDDHGITHHHEQRL